jgi:hypothetical protein
MPRVFVAYAAAATMLVLVLHSAHAHDGTTEVSTVSEHAATRHGVGEGASPLVHSVVHPAANSADCMLLELSAPQRSVVVLTVAAVPMVRPVSADLARHDRTSCPTRPPPGPRSQALLGVFLT